MIHQCKLTNLITWPFTGILPTELRDLPERVRARRGPVPDRPTLTEEERTRFFDHLLVIADAYSYEDTALPRQQAVYLLGFDARASTADWLHAEQLRALRNAGISIMFHPGSLSGLLPSRWLIPAIVNRCGPSFIKP